MIQVLEKLFVKLAVILQTAQGWALALGLLLMEYFFADHAAVVWLVLAVTLMDAAWGIAVSVTHGQFTLSELMRLTVSKIAVYGCALAVFIGLDRVAGTELGTDVVGSAITLCEAWSMSASMLIMFPHIPVLQLLRKALTGEIANKLRIAPEEVEKAFCCTDSATDGTDANGNANGNANGDCDNVAAYKEERGENANETVNENANENEEEEEADKEQVGD